MSGRDFTRTRAALAAYDAAGDAMDAHPRDASNEAALAVIAAWDAALMAVAEAFADDTADVNARATALEGWSHFNHMVKSARQFAADDK